MKISYSNNTHICVLVLLENKGVILHNYKADMNLIFRGVKGEIFSGKDQANSSFLVIPPTNS